jgi:hypothetical protein
VMLVSSSRIVVVLFGGCEKGRGLMMPSPLRFGSRR